MSAHGAPPESASLAGHDESTAALLRRSADLLAIAVVAAVYITAAKLGLTLAFLLRDLPAT